MIYITDANDDLRSLVIKHYGVHDPEAITSQMQRVREYNRASLAFARGLDSIVETGHEYIPLRPQHLLWLPYWEEVNNTSIVYSYQTTCSDANRLSASDRHKLHTMVDQGIDLKQVAATCRLREILVHRDPIHGEEKGTLDTMANHLSYVGMTTSVLGSSSGYAGGTLVRFEGELKNIGNLSKQYAQAHNLEKASIKTEVKSAYESMHQNYQRIIKNLAPPPDGTRKAHLLYSRKRLLQTAATRENGVALLKPHEMQGIYRSMKYIRVVGHGLIAIDIGATGLKVWDDLEHHQKKQAAMDIAGLAGGLLGGYIAGFITTAVIAGPVGWIALIGAIGLGVGLGYLGDKFLSYVTDELWTHKYATS